MNQLNEKLSQILFEEWDPIGINDSPTAANEYNVYAEQIALMIESKLGEGPTTILIHNFLNKSETEITLNPPNKENNLLVAKSLIQKNPPPSFQSSYPNFAHSLILLGISILGQFVIGMLLYFLVDAKSSLFLILLHTLAFGGTILFGLLLRKDYKFSWRPFSWLVALPMLLVTLALIPLREPFIYLIPGLDKFMEMMQNSLPEQDWLMIFTIGISAPIIEEILFRGIILRGLLKNINPWTAIITSAVIFGAAHMNPYQFISAVILGIFIGWLYWRTKSIWPGIMIHILNNSIVFVPSWITGTEMTDTGSIRTMMGNDLHYGLMMAACLLISVLGIWFVAKALPPVDEQNNRDVMSG